MKKMFLFILFFTLFLLGCSSTIQEYTIAEQKIKLAECYENKCDLVIERIDDEDFPLDYPSDYCYYELRKDCIQEVEEVINIDFCFNFTYSALCLEDLAVIKRNNKICESEITNSILQFFFVRDCNKYYYTTIKFLDEGLSHCSTTRSGEIDSYNCYPNLIKNFKDAEECNLYVDLQKEGTFGTSGYAKNLSICKAYFAALHNDSSICYNMESTAQKDHCFYNYAQIRREPEQCESIQNLNTKGLCLNSTYFKPKYCDTYLEEDICAKELLRYEDMGECEEMEDLNKKENCVSKVIDNIKSRMKEFGDFCNNSENSRVLYRKCFPNH
jgi:hypothetical protein